MTRPSGIGRDLYFDTEANHLLPGLTDMWCTGIIDLNTLEEMYFGPPVPEDAVHPHTGEKLWTPVLGNPCGTVEDANAMLAEANLTVAHNGIGYDYLAIEKLFPKWKRPVKAWDSLVAAKIVWPYDSLMGPDLARAKAGKMPMQLVKRHSLKAWGYRLGDYKDEYTGGFDAWNPWMASYMMQDCRPGVKLWHLIRKRVGWDEPEKVDIIWPESVFEIEHETARIIANQELDGVHFDRDRAMELGSELANEKARIEQRLVDTFGSWWAVGKETYPAIDRQVKLPQYPDVTFRRISEKTGKELAPYVGPPVCTYYADSPFTPIERVQFSPSSRDHLGQRLQALYGWKPKKFGSNGKPSVDETVLEEIPEAVMPKEIRQLVLDFFVVNKTLGMLVNGRKSWLGLASEDNRLHGRVDPCGAVTTRATHSNPNLGQCPAVRKEKVVLDDGSKVEQVLHGLSGRYGYECRELFIADTGWELTGVDASALELIDLGHYLVPYDEGAFRDRVCDPTRDPHTEHADITGLTRGDTKTATYLYVYGGSAYKLSLDLTVEPHEIPKLLAYRGLPMLLRSLAKRFDEDFVAKLDDAQKAKIAKARQIIIAFEAGITGIKDLKANVTEAAKRGYLRGMDGRKLIVRKPHAALNTLLQSAGAMTCKLWMVLTHRKLNALGLYRGKDFKQVLWVHDELQFTHRPGLGPTIRDCAYEAIKEAGELLSLRGVYRGDAKTGRNWAECH